MKIRSEYSQIKPLSNIKRQGGWTFWSLGFTLLVLAFAAYIGMQLVPIYASNNNIEKAMVQSVDRSDLKTVSRRQIINDMDKQLYLDGTADLLDYKEDVIIQRKSSKFTLEVKYERKVPIVANINLVVSFSPLVECNFAGECTKK